jgi:serine/threonine-protein kinase
LRPHYWAGYNWLGGFYYRRAQYTDAAKMFEKVTTLAPDNVRGWSNLGAAYVGLSRYRDAISVLESSIAMRPEGRAFSNLGNAYFGLRRYEEATRAFEQAANFPPPSALRFRNLGDSYYWTPGKRAQAADAYRRAISLAGESLRINPKDASALGLLAICHAMLGEKKEALELLQKGLLMVPNDPQMQFKAALIYDQFDDVPQTLTWLEKALSAGISARTIRDTPNFDHLEKDPRFRQMLDGK